VAAVSAGEAPTAERAAAKVHNVVPVANRAFEYLGKISYGIYMLHMVAIYTVSALFLRTSWWHGHFALYCAGYYGAAFSLTFLLAGVSYRYFELPFLRLKDRRFSLLPEAPVSATPATSA
jgi:peptidoglycan/LPS O-acetylase OafA/YrhL